MAPTRRQILAYSAAATAAALLPDPLFAQETPAAARRVVCFYQFDRQAIQVLTEPNGLPTRSNFTYIFADTEDRGGLGKVVRSAGPSFKYAPTFDLHRYPAWQRATDEQLRQWTGEFSTTATKAGAHYFAFNDLPVEATRNPDVRARVATMLKYLRQTLPGILFVPEKATQPAAWVESDDVLWRAVDETCEFVVGEHYHRFEDVMNASIESLSEHLFALPRWQPTLRQKFIAMHSSYYGLAPGGWGGVQSDRHSLDDLNAYFQRLIRATRSSAFGRCNIGFGPLASATLDPQMLPAVRDWLVRDLREGAS